MHPFVGQVADIAKDYGPWIVFELQERNKGEGHIIALSRRLARDIPQPSLCFAEPNESPGYLFDRGFHCEQSPLWLGIVHKGEEILDTQFRRTLLLRILTHIRPIGGFCRAIARSDG